MGGGEGERLRARARAGGEGAGGGGGPGADRAGGRARSAQERGKPPDSSHAGVLLAEGARAHRGERADRRGARRGAARDARKSAPVGEDPGLPQAEHRDEPAGLLRGRPSRRPRAPAALRRRHHAHDPLRRRGRQARRPVAARALRRRHGRDHASTQPRQLGRRPALSAGPRRLGEAGDHALRLLAVSRRERRKARPEAGDDALERADRGARPACRRQRRLWVHVHRFRADARGRRRVRLRRRVPAARADRHAGRRLRKADPHAGPRRDGHAVRRHHRNSRGGHRLAGHALGRGAVGRRGRGERGHGELRAAVRAVAAGCACGNRSVVNELESFQQQRRFKERLARALDARFLVRVHASLIMLGAVLAGWLADWAMLKSGLENTLLRYPSAVLIAYVAFLAGARVWIDRSGILGYLNPKGAKELLGSPESEESAPVSESGRGNKGWSDWVSLGLLAEQVAWLLLAVAAISVFGLLLYGMGFYLIAEAQGFFAEIVFELLLAAGLVRGMRKADSSGWVGGFVSATWPALFLVLALSASVGALAEYRYPGTKTMAELLDRIRGDSGQDMKPSW